MPIVPLPRFEAEADPKARGLSEEEIRAYQRLAPPETVVVRYGRMGMIGEFPARLDRVPGCGTKFVVKTPRGTEIGEMLTTTCSNGGCGKSLTRREMLDYIENSGGRQYPFTTAGRILRLADVHDLQHMERLDDLRRPMLRRVREIAAEQKLPMKVVDVEPILGEELLTIYFMSETRIDFRDLLPVLSEEFHSRVDLRQIGAREEARLTADYERCGQHCCCRQFLKVLKPVSMKSAKVQKGTLDPLKISGRCGRLMCCLRYEDQTYADLKKNLPHRKTRVGTPEGPGLVIDAQILTQLVLVELEGDGSRIAVPVEQLCDPDATPPRRPAPALEAARGDREVARTRQARPADDPLRGLSEEEVSRRLGESTPSSAEDQPLAHQKRHRQRARSEDQVETKPVEPAEADAAGAAASPPAEARERPGRRRRRGRRKRRVGEGAGPQSRGPSQATDTPSRGDGDAGSPDDAPREAPPASSSASGAGSSSDRREGGGKRKRRRGGRRRRHKGGGGAGPSPPT